CTRSVYWDGDYW
nr:immunoglobulin heavy chain junction region [Mus musculus]